MSASGVMVGLAEPDPGRMSRQVAHGRAGESALRNRGTMSSTRVSSGTTRVGEGGRDDARRSW